MAFLEQHIGLIAQAGRVQRGKRQRRRLEVVREPGSQWNSLGLFKTFAVSVGGCRLTSVSARQIYYIAADIFPANKWRHGVNAGLAAAQRNCAPASSVICHTISQCSLGIRHWVVVLNANIPSAFPLLDTLKVLHIWYTTITTLGWYVLEFNYSSLRYWALKLD